MAENLQQFLNLLGEYFSVEEDTQASAEVTSLQLSTLHYSGDHDKVVGILKSLESKGMIDLQIREKTIWTLTDEGGQYAKNGSPEYQVWEYVKQSNGENIDSNLKVDAVKAKLGTVAEFGLKAAMRNKWIFISGSEKHLKTNETSLQDITQKQLQIIDNAKNNEASNLLAELAGLSGSGHTSILQELKKRKLVSDKNVKFYLVKKGKEFSESVKKQLTDLTSDILLNGSWVGADFKPYNFFTAGKRAAKGSIHPLVKTMNKYKKILLSMGFEEMPTNLWVESSFWTFDTLFMPQQHPARDVQDTFFLSEPKYADLEKYPKEYVKSVHAVHEVGGYGSFGWNYPWSSVEASKNVLRTHTTATSARMLYMMAEDYKKTGVIRAKRFFSIDRVFRNETLDATHLAEFHQVEGLIAGENMGLAQLMGVLRTFYAKIGLKHLKFKPAYNPYTEPSMEIFGFHPQLKRWIEVGNSGVFRPELLLPMGLPSDVSVIAWGLSLERPTMIRYNVSNIRELFGPKASLSLS